MMDIDVTVTARVALTNQERITISDLRGMTAYLGEVEKLNVVMMWVEGEITRRLIDATEEPAAIVSDVRMQAYTLVDPSKFSIDVQVTS